MDVTAPAQEHEASARLIRKRIAAALKAEWRLKHVPPLPQTGMVVTAVAQVLPLVPSMDVTATTQAVLPHPADVTAPGPAQEHEASARLNRKQIAAALKADWRYKYVIVLYHYILLMLIVENKINFCNESTKYTQYQ